MSENVQFGFNLLDYLEKALAAGVEGAGMADIDDAEGRAVCDQNVDLLRQIGHTSPLSQLSK